jgi:hypothetical protein
VIAGTGAGIGLRQVVAVVFAHTLGSSRGSEMATLLPLKAGDRGFGVPVGYDAAGRTSIFAVMGK